MYVSRRKTIFIIPCLLLPITLAACGGETTEDKIHDHLEEAVSSEEGFAEQQDPIVELEQKEQSLYAEIIDLEMDDLDKIKELSRKAQDTIEKRSDKIQKEQESMETSKQEFAKVKELIDELDKDEKEQERAEKMYNTMMKRYDAYDTLHSSYVDSLDLENKLYTMLPDEEVGQDDLTEHISNINDHYEDVLEANKEFNTYTKKYNERKKDFYKAADLKIDYQKDETDD